MKLYSPGGRIFTFMDELEGRLHRIYSALEAVEETDLTRFEVTSSEWRGHNTLGVDYRGGLSDEQLSNLAHSGIHNVAHLEDHLIRWAKTKGLDSRRVSATVARSMALQVVIDLSNNDKHGYPPRDGGRSGHAPRIPQVERFMKMGRGSWVGLRFGADGVAHSEGQGSVVIGGKIVDRQDNVIGELHDMLHEAIGTWELLLAELQSAANGIIT